MVYMYGGGGAATQYVVARTMAPGGQRGKTNTVDGIYARKLRKQSEAKLRARKLAIEKSTLEYYYDVLDLCRRMDASLLEETKLSYPLVGAKAQRT